MFQALYDFFYNIITNGIDFENNTILSDLLFNDWTITIGTQGIDYNIGQLLPFYFALISLVIIIVLCCLFVYKIIKLIGGLIR